MKEALGKIRKDWKIGNKIGKLIRIEPRKYMLFQANKPRYTIVFFFENLEGEDNWEINYPTEMLIDLIGLKATAEILESL